MKPIPTNIIVLPNNKIILFLLLGSHPGIELLMSIQAMVYIFATPLDNSKNCGKAY